MELIRRGSCEDRNPSLQLTISPVPGCKSVRSRAHAENSRNIFLKTASSPVLIRCGRRYFKKPLAPLKRELNSSFSGSSSASSFRRSGVKRACTADDNSPF